MKRTYFSAIVGFAAFLFGVSPALAVATSPLLVIPNNKLPKFAVLSGAAVSGSTTAGTSVSGDVGSGIASVSNFPPSTVVSPGVIHVAADSDVTQALIDARAAWTDMGNQGALAGAITLVPELAGVTLNGGGVYNFTAAANIASPGGAGVTGTLTLNGGANDIYIFNVGSSLTANVGTMVVGTANPCNIFWRMGTNGSATLNGNSFFGTVIADQAVTVASTNTLTGKVVGIVAAVTMPGAGGNTIGGCSAAAVVPAPAGVTCPAGLTAIGGAPGTATVTLSAPAPVGGTVVTLTSSAPGTASVPASVTVPAGATSATFTVTPGATQGTATISATTAGGTVACTLTVAASIPTLGFAGLTLLMVLLAGIGLFALKRFSI